MPPAVIIERLFALVFLIVLVDRLYIMLLRGGARHQATRVPPAPEYPDVAVQLPMFNEWQVFERVIACSCALDWPRDKLHIQVLDDSDNPEIVAAIDRLVTEKAALGHDIQVFRRPDRRGYKAGSLQRAMSYLRAVPYVVIFDADFEPTPDFLQRTVPILHADDSLAFVQARWTYSNPNSSALTKLQKVALDFHHRGEQQGRSNAQSFLNFNGSAGVWRVSAIVDSGGWSGETLVEDMDLSLRAFTRGLLGTYVDDLECLNELPDTDRTYRIQQRRWLAGPMHLATMQAREIWLSSHLNIRRKIAASWFFVRYAYNFFNIAYVLIAVPLLMAARTDVRVSVTLFVASSLIPFVFNPRYWYIAPLYAFGWDYSYFKLKSVIEGLLRTEGTRSWTVTQRSTAKGRKVRRINADECLISAGAIVIAAIALSTGNAPLALYAGGIAAIYVTLSIGIPGLI